MYPCSSRVRTRLRQGGAEIPGQRVTHTGRQSSKSNSVYDVRHATLEVIVASDRIGALLAALTAQNLMTVTGLSLEEVEVSEDLAGGYFYGNEDHVVRATIDIETVWLRFWTSGAMPAAVREFLGVVLPEPEQGVPQG